MKQIFYKLRMPDTLIVLIRGMHPLIKKKVKESLKIILNDSYIGKALKEELIGLHSFRVGAFRIIYKISSKEIQLVAIGPRKTIYRDTFKMLIREK